jgi:glutamate--cysteine ligase
VAANDAPLRTYDELFAPLHGAEKPASAWRVGAEMEKFGVTADGAPLPFHAVNGGPSVEAFLTMFLKEHRFFAEPEYEGGPVIALAREEAGLRESITLEPGSQFELSGAAHSSMFAVAAEFDAHLAALRPLSEELGVTWLGTGFHPFSKRADYAFVPKLRYAVMREYLPTRGQYGLDMMLRTSTVQANYDYSDEADAIKKLQVATKLAPLNAALFANSPFYEGELTENASYRSRVWLDVDNSRSGLVAPIWQAGAGYKEYIEWALDAPMFLFKRAGKVVDNRGQAFRDFWKNGFQGHFPTHGDWETHLNTLFPEVRLKKTIEIRSADAQGNDTAIALPALWTGLLYDSQALAEANALVADFSFDEISALRPVLWQKGLQTPFRGGTLADVASDVLRIAAGGLERRAIRDTSGVDERVFLATLKDLVAAGKTPADRVRERLGENPAKADILAALAL